jgi:hypothetical protein
MSITTAFREQCPVLSRHLAQLVASDDTTYPPTCFVSVLNAPRYAAALDLGTHSLAEAAHTWVDIAHFTHGVVSPTIAAYL